MSVATTSAQAEIDTLRMNVQALNSVVRRNLQDITNEESLEQPRPAGNCINWVLGHLVCVYNEVLPLVGQKPVVGKDALQRYTRGSAPVVNAQEATSFPELVVQFDRSAEAFETGIASLAPEALDHPAPVSPRNNPNETVRSLLGLIVFHQGYHAGQLGILRRMVGKKGAIA